MKMKINYPEKLYTFYFCMTAKKELKTISCACIIYVSTIITNV